MRAPRTLAQEYQQFGAAAGADSSPLRHRVALGLSESGPALRVLGTIQPSRRHPAVVLAALDDLALSGRAAELAAAYAAGDGDAAAAAAVGALVGAPDAVADLVAARRMAGDECSRSPVLLPGIARAVQRTGATALGLIDLGRPAGLNLIVDRVGVSYGNGQSAGDRSSPVQLSAGVVGHRGLRAGAISGAPLRKAPLGTGALPTHPLPTHLLPTQPLPGVVIRSCLARDPLDVTDAADVRWLRACVGADRAAQRNRLDAELALAATAPPLLRRGDPIDALPGALAAVPAGVLPVVMTTWALSRFPVKRRLRFLDHLEQAGADRPVAWVSAEGVGVAPGIPTFGDRPASGHSILGVAVIDRSGLRAEAVGRCWSRGAILAWLAEEQQPGLSPSAAR